ncbi:MAG: serine hydrolase [Acidobacteria bacterium]|nr:serine hydrolase [Acidobacteriota bacterium]
MLLVISLSLLATAAARPKLPKTIPARRLDAMLYALNTGNRELIRDFIKENYTDNALLQRTPDDRAATYLRLHADTGGFDLRQIVESSDHSITVLVEARKTEEWYRITCPVDLASPHNIMGVTFKLVPRPKEFGGERRYTEQQAVAELDRYVSKLASEDMFSGVVMLSRRPANCAASCQAQPLFQKAINSAGAKEAYGPDTPFALASINKIFVAVAVAQLQYEKKLGFLDPVSKYLPEFPKPRGERITIHQLLTHTAGLEPFMSADAFAEMRRAKITTVGELSRFFGSRPAIAAPGEKFVYGNADYMLLQAIVQVVTGEPFDQYAREHIFAPAGMNFTHDGVSSAADLTRFGAALLSHKLLPPDATKYLMAGKVHTDDPDTMYAYGLETESINGVRVVGHAGGGVNVSDQFDMYPDLGYVVVVLSTQPGSAQHVTNKIREMLCVK